MTPRLKLVLATLALAVAPGCFSIQAPLPTPAPVPAPRLPPTQPGFHDVGNVGQSDLGEACQRRSKIARIPGKSRRELRRPTAGHERRASATRAQGVGWIPLDLVP